jgi:S1-C subfamily serine protease
MHGPNFFFPQNPSDFPFFPVFFQDSPGLFQIIPENIGAHAQGLRPGDIILRVNGEPLTSPQQFTRLKLTMGAGDTLELTIRRGDLILERTVPLTPTEVLEGYR